MAEKMKSKDYWIKHLNLVEHPGDEDGYFVEAFRDSHIVKSIDGEDRNVATIAYFLQERAPPLGPKTMFFQCKSSEMIYYHFGSPMNLYYYPKDGGKLEKITLGPKVDENQKLCAVMPKGCWFTRLVESDNVSDFTVFSCSLAPGFEIQDFKAKIHEELTAK